jgi:hypothetical protein
MFQQMFNATEAINKERKMSLIVKRLMDIQRRAKIKPSAMNPILLPAVRPNTK